MWVKNNEPNSKNLAGLVSIGPGKSVEIDSETWAKLMAVKLIKAMVETAKTEDGKPVLEVIADNENGGSYKAGTSKKAAKGGAPQDLGEMTVDEASKLIAKSEDRAQLEAWDAAETDGKNRQGVHDAIEKQLATLDEQ